MYISYVNTLYLIHTVTFTFSYHYIPSSQSIPQTDVRLKVNVFLILVIPEYLLHLSSFGSHLLAVWLIWGWAQEDVGGNNDFPQKVSDKIKYLI